MDHASLRRGATTLVAALCIAAPAMAAENGQLNYPVGLSTVGTGVVPPPGENFIQNYTVYYTAGRTNDSSGNSAVPGFELDVKVNATRLIHTWDLDLGQSFGGQWSLGSGVVLTGLQVDVDTAFGGSKDTGVGDVLLEPLILGWRSGDYRLHANFLVNFYIPTENEVSTGFASIDPVLTVSWFATPWLELTGAAIAEIPLTNDDTDYRSGVTLAAEGGVNLRVIEAFPKFAFGVVGYAARQITDDKVNGARFGDGHKLQVFALGPQIAWGTEKAGVALKWQHEFAAQNHAEGNRFWLQGTLQF